MYLSRHRNILVAEAFLRSLVELYGKHIVYSDGWRYLVSCRCATLCLKHRLHSTFENSIVERAIEYVKDRTECFDYYYPCIKEGIQFITCLSMDR